MKSISVKWPIIIFCSFVLLCAISMIYINRKYANEFTTYNDEQVLGDTYASCYTKDYESCGCNRITNSTAKEACKNGCSTCRTCDTSKGHYLKNGRCFKPDSTSSQPSTTKPSTSTNLKISISGASTIGIARGIGTVSTTYTLKDSKGNEVKGSWTIEGAKANCSNSSKCSVTFSHGGATCKAQKTATITASANGKTATYSVTVYSFDSWKKSVGRWEFSSKQPSRNDGKFNASCSAYEGEYSLGNKLVYKQYYNRCCGSAPASTYTCYIYNKNSEIKLGYSKNSPGSDWKAYNKNDCGACFGNTREFKNATKVKWSTQGNEPGYLYMYDVSEDGCNLPPELPDLCEDSVLKGNTKNVRAETCDGKTAVEVNDTICSGSSSKLSYYSVNINKKYSSQVDYEEYTTKPGVGFKYNVYVKEDEIINSKFDYEKWKKDYNNNYDNMRKYKDDNPWYYYYYNILEKLKDNLKYYNDNYVNGKNAEITADMSLNIAYNLNKKAVNMTFDKFIKDETQSTSSVSNTGLNEIKITTKDGNQFVTYNASQAISNVIKLIPQRAILDRQRSTILYDSRNPDASLGEFDGGNKMYITSTDVNGNKFLSYPDNGEYILNLTTNVDGNIITNDKCSLNIQSTNLLYRIINVANPFINNKYDKGINWYNAYNDYTGVIESNTWSLPSKYIFTLNSDSIRIIKKDNDSSEGKNKYLGTCYLPIGNLSRGPDIICSQLE